MSTRRKKWKDVKRSGADPRMEIFRYAMVIACALVALKLFSVQVLEHGFYSALASGQHEIFQELIPKRGSVFVHDEKDETLVPIATNQQLAFVFADPRLIERPDKTAEAVAEVFDYNDEQFNALKTRLDRPEDPYEPIEKEVDDKTLEKLMSKDLDGILYVRESARIYPDPALGGHLIGFLGSDTNGVKKGRYGIEGFFDGALAGTQGSIRGQRDVAGRLVSLTDRSVEPAIDGADIVLTIDRTIQYMACSMLKQAVTQHGADGGSVVVVEPSTGRVLAMCGAPDFDSNTYGSVDSITQFNNPAIFEAYEPGSIFKPFTMAGAVDSGSVTPTTTFEDVGSAKVDGWPKPIGNAQGKVYGTVNMTQVLEDSINTGMIFSMRQMGQQTFVEYVKRFGFGTLTGIELETELPGNISSLDQSSEIYAATATFGQGITATPIQLVMAYAAIANGGVLKRPQIVDEIRYSEGTVEKRAGQDVTQVIDQKTARTLGAMLVSVIEHGHGKRAGVPGYYIAGKTGTAQVARTDGIGYDEDNTIGSFAGFGPVEDPRFAMVVRIDNPRDVVWAESTAAPLFGKIAEFLLEYFEVEPVRQVDT